MYGDRLNLANNINRMTKFSKLNLAWPGWPHSIPKHIRTAVVPAYSRKVFTSKYKIYVPVQAAPFGRFLPPAARIEHSIFRALHDENEN